MPQFHHSEIEHITGCPCNPSAPFDDNNYRAVHDDIKNPDNFLPKAILEPECLDGANDKKACGCWGLSMFDSPENLRKMVEKVEKRVPNFRKKIGANVAKMKLSNVEGVRTATNNSGHFDFYAYDTCNYLLQVESVKKY